MAFKLKVIFFWWRVGLIYWFMRVLEGNFGAFFSIWIWNDSFIINQTGRNIPKPLKHYNFKLVCWLTSVWLKRPLSQITNNETLIRFLCRQFRGFIVFFFRTIKYLVTSNMSIFYCGPSRVLVFSIISFHSELSLSLLEKVLEEHISCKLKQRSEELFNVRQLLGHVSTSKFLRIRDSMVSLPELSNGKRYLLEILYGSSTWKDGGPHALLPTRTLHK